ncbi:Pimeloyl-ACP methyl ester carboxylesterase [Paramicrobacterium humi]|uniref:Pimeloyl-ACP methyl ester carboxylesterase n=1 Tax=Paramicrobacterium humi TaxID=640635 RepID=A0A1H4JA34_9MICO|nr:alpha/beta fold hydrolase [Microbacterium humi]SEB43189.1 Pimeloyl-ACP methyl ester carboxylesterase [Microbacterium humi]
MLPSAPLPYMITAPDGLQLATYEIGDADAAPVVLVHGFASSAELNWVLTGWSRELTRAGWRVLALDQRAHGASDKPHEASAYTMAALVADVLTLLDAYGVASAPLVGYSLGARVAWQAALAEPGRVTRAVLGGIPAGDPLARFDLEAARAFAADRTPIGDALTRTFIEMAAGLEGNDLWALIALVEGMRGGDQAGFERSPSQPLLLATGSADPVLDQSRALAAAASDARFLEIPGRHHFNAPTARAFRQGAIEFLREGRV